MDPLFVQLAAAAFPGSGHPDASIHVPSGFDAKRRPGLVIYFHGWNGCVSAALSSEDLPCEDGEPARRAGDLARQVDEAQINAVLLAIELRVDAATGEPGRLAMPGAARDFVRELFSGPLSSALGFPLPVDDLDRVVIVAHSGGYQAAAAFIAAGDLLQIREVILLDALYGADDVFREWIERGADRFDANDVASLRFADIYTSDGGTAWASRALAEATKNALGRLGRAGAVADEDDAADPSLATLAHPVVFKRVPRRHGDLPRVYVLPLLRAGGFAPIHAAR